MRTPSSRIRAIFVAVPVALVGALASASLSLAATPPCSAPTDTCVPLTWDPAQTAALTVLYQNPPSTPQTLAGVDFAMSNALISLAPGGSTSTASGFAIANASAAHLLLNGAFVFTSTLGQTAGTVTLTFSDGSTLTTPLVVGTNLRDWRVGGGAGVVSTVTSPASATAWTGLSLDNVPAALDRLTIAIPGRPANLVGVTVATAPAAAGLNIRLFWSGLTLVDSPPPPAPAPGPGPQDPDDAAKHCQAEPAANGQHAIGECVREAAHERNEAREKPHADEHDAKASKPHDDHAKKDRDAEAKKSKAGDKDHDADDEDD